MFELTPVGHTPDMAWRGTWHSIYVDRWKTKQQNKKN